MGVFEELILKYVLEEEPVMFTHAYWKDLTRVDENTAKAAAQIFSEAEMSGTVPNVPVGFRHWYKYPEFREAVAVNGSTPEKGLAFLYLQPDTNTWAIEDVCAAIKLLGSRPRDISLVADKIGPEHKHLYSAGFCLVTAQAAQGTAQGTPAEQYVMVRLGPNWGYAERGFLSRSVCSLCQGHSYLRQ
jgi:hypothetical protein